MVDEIPKGSELSDDGSEYPVRPAFRGRTLVLIAIALGLSTAICCVLRHDKLPSETGTIKGREAPMVSNWTGRIERYLVKPGDVVEKGDPVAILVNEHLILEVDRVKREVAEIQTALKQIEQSADDLINQKLPVLDNQIADLRSLAAASATTPFETEKLAALENERINLTHHVRESLGISRIRKELARSTASLENLRAKSLRITVPAPVTGVVRRLLRAPGERIVQGTPFLELADQSRPYLIVELPEPTAKRFALGDTIPLKFPGSERSVGRVAHMERITPGEGQVAGSLESAERGPRVRLEIEPNDGDWPDAPLKSAVRVRTSGSDALSRRVH